MELALKNQSELFLGRQNTCDVVLPGEAVSRKHARIVKENHDWLLEDLHSKHGTKLNGETLVPNEKRILRESDQIQIGNETITISIDPASLEEPEPYYLVYLNGPNSGQRITLDPKKPELILGRLPEVEIAIDNKNISRKHAKIKQDIDGVWIEDLNSKNGTFVNEQKISESTLLKDADQIQLGDLKLAFVDSNAALLKRLSILPAFQETPPETPLKKESVPILAASKAPAPVESSHWIDYAYMGLMGLVVMGLLIGAFLWLKG